MSLWELNAVTQGFRQMHCPADEEVEGVAPPSEDEFLAMRDQLGI